ncbi:Polygalacturonase [Sesamum alatum]|uniref:Polygalacturonase n=1 Tax=Sesamum alatum TaxID=300844 RepID=A0AAE2CWZ5_9LAMI|nr:Polygalacturonase [Sesamum alatum]
MALTLITILFFLPLLAPNANAQQPVTYDVRKYSAKPGADISQAVLDAWKEACNSTSPSTVFIPPGTWLLSQVKLLGPNKAPIELQVQGTLQASPDPSKLPNKEGEWITINYVNFLTLTGGGVLDAPGDSPNTDGIHVARSTNIRITDSIIKTGDDCVSMGDETKEVYIQNVTCGPGHGISIGSLGGYATEKDVTGVYVKNCTFIGTTNGVRVKTWPSAPATLTVSELHFEDLIMDNASLPIVIDQEYCPHNLCNKDRPSSIKISNVSIKNVRGTTSTAEAVWLVCSSLKPCENVEVGDIDLTYTGNQGPITTQCTNVKPKFVGKQNPPVCAATAKSA